MGRRGVIYAAGGDKAQLILILRLPERRQAQPPREWQCTGGGDAQEKCPQSPLQGADFGQCHQSASGISCQWDFTEVDSERSPQGASFASV